MASLVFLTAPAWARYVPTNFTVPALYEPGFLTCEARARRRMFRVPICPDHWQHLHLAKEYYVSTNDIVQT